FGSEIRFVSNVLLDEAVFVMTADDGIGKIQIFNDGLQFAGMVFSDFAAKDDRELVGLTDGTVSVHQTLAQSIYCGPAGKDQVVAQLHLRKEQPVFNACLLTLPYGEEGGQQREPFSPASRE